MLGLPDLLAAVKCLRFGAKSSTPTSVTPDLRHPRRRLHEKKTRLGVASAQHGVLGDSHYLEEVGTPVDFLPGPLLP